MVGLKVMFDMFDMHGAVIGFCVVCVTGWRCRVRHAAGLASKPPRVRFYPKRTLRRKCL